MRDDSIVLTGITATAGPFQLFGGRYGLSIVNGGGAWKMMRVLPDGVTLFNMIAFSGPAGTEVAELPPGEYFVQLTGTDTGSDVEVVRF